MFDATKIQAPATAQQFRLREVSTKPCKICGLEGGSDPHHLRVAGHQRGLGVKNGDDYTIPLCRKHHDELHAFGDEGIYLAINGIALEEFDEESRIKKEIPDP